MSGKYRDGKRREIIRELQLLHQATYMGERYEYYKRREDSLSHPSIFLSDISDGMAGSKTIIPSFADRLEFSPNLKIHVRDIVLFLLLTIFLIFNIEKLQGVLFHGRRLDLYRSYGNLKHTSNLATHCWLLSLEKIFHQEGKLPDTIYHEVTINFVSTLYFMSKFLLLYFARLMAVLKTLQE